MLAIYEVKQDSTHLEHLLTVRAHQCVTIAHPGQPLDLIHLPAARPLPTARGRIFASTPGIPVFNFVVDLP